jgi:hypothetical protein
VKRLNIDVFAGHPEGFLAALASERILYSSWQEAAASR